jgi:hypothetical protein
MTFTLLGEHKQRTDGHDCALPARRSLERRSWRIPHYTPENASFANVRNGSKADTRRSELPSYSRSNFDYVGVGQPLMLQAGERSITQCSSKMRLTFLYRCRAIGSGHRILAQLNVIEMFDVHRHTS